MSDLESGYVNWMGLDDEKIKPWGGEDFERLAPGGPYLFEVVDAKIEPSKKAGSAPNLVLTSKCLTEGAELGKTTMMWYNLATESKNDAAKRRFRQIVNACRLAPDGRGGVNVSAFLGKRYAAKAIENEYQDFDKTGAPVTRVSTKLCNEAPIDG